MTVDLSSRTTAYWWLSFVDRVADYDGNTAAMHLGVAIVCGRTFDDAIAGSWRSGCNPGGEVVGSGLPDWDISPAFLYRLIEGEEIDDAQREVIDARARTEAGKAVHS